MPRFLQETDTRFFAAVALLVALGLIFLSSVSAPLAYERYGSRSYYLVHQLWSGVLPGAVLLVLAARLRRPVLERCGLWALAGSVVLLIAVLIPGLGVTRGGAQSWLDIGFVTFQPAELAKVGLILALASWATVRRPLWFHPKAWARGFLPFLGVLGGVLGIIGLQPDLGTMLIIAAIGVAMAFVGGMQLRHLGLLALGGIAALTALIAAAPYRVARLTAFLHPELDPQGIGYQVNQALLAVGSGGWFGVGLGHSRQKFAFLPEVISDSIFAIVAEEIGFIFSLAFLALIAYVIARVLRNAMDATDEFDRLVLVGIAAWWGVQSVVNIGAMVGMLPLTGLPLPFVSSGGTALAVSLGAAGIVLNLSRTRGTAARHRR
ncbi:MAG: putative peptidoglycan glycosyltransferase FtsW [bacterium]|nr:putative peptidoglycan glycosyltransferase FtsW [bacterium]